MKLIFNETVEHIKNAVNKANEILNNPEFYTAIACLPQMDNTKLTSKQIADTIQNSSQEIQIKCYQAWNPFSSVNAKTLSENLIKINTRRFSQDIKVAVNTLIHESVHAIDMTDNHLDFTHSSNYPSGQEKTVPWVIGALSEKFI